MLEKPCRRVKDCLIGHGQFHTYLIFLHLQKNSSGSVLRMFLTISRASVAPSDFHKNYMRFSGSR